MSILPIFAARLRNFQKWRLPQRRAFALLSTRNQIPAPVFSGPSEKFCTDPPPRASIQKWSKNLKNQGCICKKEKQCPSSCEWWGRTAGGGHFQSKCKDIYAERKPWVTDAENDCAASSTQKPYNATLPNRWIGRAGAADEGWMQWPPRSPDLTPRDSFLWGYVKEQVFVPPLPLDIDKLKLRVTAAIETLDSNMSEREWDGLDYRLDICRVTSGSHIEHL
jgi:hypothetical protein